MYYIFLRDINDELAIYHFRVTLQCIFFFFLNFEISDKSMTLKFKYLST